MKRFSIIELSMITLLAWAIVGSSGFVISGEENPRSHIDQEARENPEPVVQHGHAGAVRSLSFSFDNKLLATAGTDGMVKLWNAVTGQLLRTISASKYWIYCVEFSPDGKIVAVGSGDHTVSLWDVETGKRLRELKGHIDAVQAIAFSKDGKKLVSTARSSAEDQETALIVVWDVHSGDIIQQIHGGGGVGHRLLFLPDSENIVVAVEAWDKPSRVMKSTLRIYNTATRALRMEFEAPKNVIALKYSSADDTLAVAGKNQIEVRTVNVHGKKSEPLSQNIPNMMDLAFLDGGKTLALFNPSGIDFQDVDTGKHLKHIEGTIHNPMLGTFSFNAERLAYVTADGSIMLMDVQKVSTRKIIASQSAAVKDVAFLSSQNLFALALDNGIVGLWSLIKGTQENALIGHTDAVNSVSFSPTEMRLASSGNEGKIIIWDVQSRRMIDNMVIPQQMNRDPYQNQKYWSREKIFNKYNLRPAPPRVLRINGDTPRDPRSLYLSRYSPAGEIVALAGYKFVSLYDPNKRILNDLPIEKMAISALAYSPDGNSMVTGSETGRIDIWDMKLRQKKLSLDAHQGLINAIAFSTDKIPILGTAGNDKVIKLWDPLTGKPLFSMQGHSSPVAALAFGHQGAFIASGSIDGTIILWDVKSRNPLKVFRGHSSSVNALLYTSNGKYLISGSEDGTMTLWDSNTYEKVASVIPLKEAWLVVDPDGYFDGTRQAWQMVPFRFPSELLKLYEPEQFFNLFYQPGLLSDIYREGKPMREILRGRGDPRANLDISKYRNSKLPEVTIVSPEVGFKTGEREIRVTIEANDTGSGIRDLRIFRNQTLVNFEHGDLKPDTKTKTYRLSVPVKLVPGVNEITAYAFNRDNVKSKDSTITVTGSDSLKRKGTAYILAVGVNQYSNPEWNLNFAVNDAKGISEMLGQSFKKLDTYSQVIPVTLLNGDATKANLLTALGLLSGTITNIPSGAPNELNKLRLAEPEDDIIVYFSGHGMAEMDRYYLIPHDMGYQGKRVNLDKAGREIIMKHSLSDQDLNKGFEKVDAGRIMLIIDACQSGQALESEEKRRGPMNSRGLAQLAYEKGMYILAATQSYQAALELKKLNHGLLTYTLIEEGLKQFAADKSPKDNQITAEEWLDYATQHAGREVETAKAQYAKKKGEEIDGGEVTVTGQSPRAYYRRERVGDPWVVGKK